MLSDDLGEKKKLWHKDLNFGMCSEVFSLGCSSFSRNNVCKRRLCCDKPS